VSKTFDTHVTSIGATREGSGLWLVPAGALLLGCISSSPKGRVRRRAYQISNRSGPLLRRVGSLANRCRPVPVQPRQHDAWGAVPGRSDAGEMGNCLEQMGRTATKVTRDINRDIASIAANPGKPRGSSW
jgi:hypothetical protein